MSYADLQASMCKPCAKCERACRKAMPVSCGSERPYARQDALTDPGALSALYDDLPVGRSALREVVSQLITHVDWAARYGIPPTPPFPTQPVADRLKLIQSIYFLALFRPCAMFDLSPQC